MSTRTRFEKEAKDNSEMVYYGGREKKSSEDWGSQEALLVLVLSLFFQPHEFLRPDLLN